MRQQTFILHLRKYFALTIICNYFHSATSTPSLKKWEPYYQNTNKPKSLIRGHNAGRGPEKWSLTLRKEQKLYSIKEKNI